MSSPCMVSLTSPSDRHYKWVSERARAKRELAALVYSLVIEAVHPGNLGALPPSPNVLIGKADFIGLISAREYSILVS